MAANELFELLETLTQQELTGFARFLDNHGHGSKTLPAKLLHWSIANPATWRGIHEAGDKRQLHQAIQQVLFSKQESTHQRVRRVFMDLKKHLEAYILQLSTPKLPAHMDQQLRLLAHLLKRNSPKLFEKRLQEFEQFLDQEAELSPDAYLARMWLEKMRIEYHIHQNLPSQGFGRVNDAVARFYLSSSLEIFTATNSRPSAAPQDLLFEQQVMSMVGAEVLTADPFLDLWASVHNLARMGGTAQKYEQVMQSLEGIRHRLPKIALRQIRGHMFNYLARSADQGSRKYYQQLWDLLRTMLEEGTLHMPDGRIAFQHFLAIVRAACFCGQHIWAREFLQLHGPQLIPSEGHVEQLQYCDMLIGFHAEDYKATWHALLTYHPRTEILSAFTRTLQIQIAFELGKSDEFERLIAAFRRWLKRDQDLSPRSNSMLQAFTNLAERLGKGVFGTQAINSSFLNKVQSSNSAEKLWLIRKTQSLLAKSESSS